MLHKIKKVEIEITDGHNYVKSVKNGMAYTSVGYSTNRYGGSSPCDNETEIQRAIKHAKEAIKREGDIPIVVDNRKIKGLNRWLG